MTTLFSDKNIVPITELEQSAFCQTEGNLRTKHLKKNSPGSDGKKSLPGILNLHLKS